MEATVELVRRGIPYEAVSHLAAQLSMPLAEMARYMNVSERTLQRYSNDRILSRDMTERLVLIARLFARGFEVFGDMEDLKEWMLTPNQAVGGKAPTSLLDTTMGIGVLTNILGRIEYGVYS